MHIVREIDKGGFGIVEEVIHDGKRYARKTFSPNQAIVDNAEDREKARRRFIRETKIQQGINHPNIMPITVANMEDDPPWFLMPLADESYDAQIQRDRLNNTVTLQPLLDILAGLEELHRLGYVHRDLTPKNILLLEDKWVLSDLGLVLPKSRTTTILTSTNSAWGTELYAAPEIIHSFKNAPPQADIYSFGCILHDIVGNPFRIPYSQVTYDGPLGPVIERCTASEPAQRFVNIAFLRSALVLILSAPLGQVEGTEQVKEWVDMLESDPASITEATWEEIIRKVERETNSTDAQVLMRAIDVAQLESLEAIAPRLFARLVPLMCEWVQEGEFVFAYCDVLGSRLSSIYELGAVREKAEATMAAFELGYSHNRWSVMRKFMNMASEGIDRDLADRLAIDILAMGRRVLTRIRQIESEINADRSELHPQIQRAFEQLQAQLEK
jgi:serine/threonine protein kinase